MKGAIVSVALATIVACGFRQGNRVLIPEGYIGWVRIYYGVPEAEALMMEDGKVVIRISADGVATTSSLPGPGYGSDEYFYVSSTGRQEALKLEGVENQSDDFVHDFLYQSAPAQATLFFVGRRHSMNDYPRPTLDR